jgi:hypothetical protein
MKEIKDIESVSNERFYLAPHEHSTLLFEKELSKNNINFHKDDTFFLGPSVVYSFFERDLATVNLIFDKIQKDEFKQEETIKQRKKKKKIAKRKTLEYRQKQISVWILILIGIIIISILIL